MKLSAYVCEANNRAVMLSTAIGVVLLLVNVLLAQQNQKLKVLASKPDRALEIRAGTLLPPLEGRDGDGNRQSLRYGQDGRKTVLFVFSPRCRTCRENMPNWGAIIQGLDRQGFRLAAVSLQSEGAKEYAAQYGIDRIPLLTEIDPKYKVAYQLALTPQMILIDSEGKAEKVWTGLLQEEEKQEIERVLDVRFPRAGSKTTEERPAW